MKFGLNVVPVYPHDLIKLAQRAEQLGFESLWQGEHVVTPFAPVTGYPSASKPPFDPNSRFLEPLNALSAIAGATTTIRLGTGIMILPLQSVFHLARAITTLDVLSSGRLSLGVGTGWMRDEFDVVGRPFEQRGAVMDEMIDLIEALFNEERPEYHGTHYDFPPVGFEPKPAQRPHPPWLIGGASKPAFRRAARVGDGWYGGSQPADEVREILAEINRQRADLGRADLPFEVTVLAHWGETFDAETVAAYEAVGVHRMVYTPWRSSRAAMEAIEQFALDAQLAGPRA